MHRKTFDERIADIQAESRPADATLDSLWNLVIELRIKNETAYVASSNVIKQLQQDNQKLKDKMAGTPSQTYPSSSPNIRK